LSLPISRNTNYAPGSQVLSADLNALQDQFVTDHGTKTLQIPFAPPTASTGNTNALNDYGLTGANASLLIPIPLSQGNKILAVRARIKDSATGPTKIRITLRSETDGVASIIGTPIISAGSGALQTIAQTGITTVIAALSTYTIALDLQTGTTLSHIYAVEVDFSRPT
jgi:hypothetical protein